MDRHFPRERPIKGTEEAGCFWIGAAIGAGGQILGGLLASGAAGDAADAQAAALQAQIDLQREMWQQQRKDIKPWRETGETALNRLAYLLGVGGEDALEAAQPGDVEDDLMQRFSTELFEADPGYQYRLAEGEKAIDRAAAARGMYSNPATVRELTRHGQGLADQTYQDAFNRWRAEQGDRFNRLASLSGSGQVAVGQLQSAAQNYANTAGPALANIGAAQSAGILGGQNALIQGLTGATSGIGNQLAFNRGMTFGGGGGFGGFSSPTSVSAFGYGR